MFFQTNRPFAAGSPRFLFEQLEERIVLDAAVCAAVQESVDVSCEDLNQETTGENTPESQQELDGLSPNEQPDATDPSGENSDDDLSVVLISNVLQDAQALSEAVVDGVEIIVYDAQTGSVDSIIVMLEELVESSGQDIGHVAILSHGASGTLSFGVGEAWTLSLLEENPNDWSELGDLLSDDARIDLYGCSIGQGEHGELFVETLAEITETVV